MHWQIFCAKLLVTAPVALLTLAILNDMTQTKVAKTSKATVSVMGSLAIDN
jgi:hypothetical protein